MMSVYTNPEDVLRAEKQMAYKSLSPEERLVQDRWANQKGLELAPCPNNFNWIRHRTGRGYECSDGMHYIPDDLVAEGMPGMYTTARRPSDIINHLVRHSNQKIPNDFCGIVRPVSQCPMTGRWEYPRWSAGMGEPFMEPY
ncbi:hypothetical protein BKA67DRAFT_693384 [Truncatella angustata]|uniref:Uncharacterized protein n=1 Tax=Truncatella angustata TaxID=152316 RepID=A0A9P8UHH2_9PEZI|nr:uncharacterized protein BKA67DRAFT_693384 [Truncatella angustata]KAH6652198.1 hypothetical protein BKA67DRAFT_693384 [Truncatella angustata]